MTPEERRYPEIIKPSRRKRIAAGSGTSQAEVNQLLNQFKQMQKMMSQFGQMGLGGGKRGKLRSLLPGGNPLAGMDPAELEAMMQGGGMGPGGMPGMGQIAAPSRPKQKSQTRKKKKSKGRRR
jgi:signal recognition particle subunit SRP54